MTKTILAAILAAATLVAPSAHAQSAVPSDKSIPTITVQERQVQEAWWAARAARHAERLMATCMIMPKGSDRRTISDLPSNKG